MSIDKPYPVLFELQSLVTDLAHIERSHHHAGHERPENDIEHSFSVALLCWYICDTSDLHLDLSKVIKYAMVHDFVERYAGDVNTYASEDERRLKLDREKVALQRLENEFREFTGLVNAMHAYEAKSDEEATFVWSVDKMQALILGDMDDWRPYKKIGITYESFFQKHSGQLANCSPYCKEIFQVLLDYCLKTFPNNNRQ